MLVILDYPRLYKTREGELLDPSVLGLQRRDFRGVQIAFRSDGQVAQRTELNVANEYQFRIHKSGLPTFPENGAVRVIAQTFWVTDDGHIEPFFDHMLHGVNLNSISFLIDKSSDSAERFRDVLHRNI